MFHCGCFVLQYERKHEKEQNKELTEKLDKEYKQLLGSLSKGSVSSHVMSIVKPLCTLCVISSRCIHNLDTRGKFFVDM